MDEISLHGVRAYGRHGANPGERDHRQLFEIDLTAQIDLSRAAAQDDLADTLDYAALHARLVRIVATTSYSLLERLAADLVDAVLEDRRIAGATVRVAKPGILDGATPSVTLQRRNPALRSE